MISQISFRRMLYVGAGLITVVAAILAIMVIPPSTIPKGAVTPIWVIVIVHLLIIVALLRIVHVNKLGGRTNKALLVLAGVTIIVLSFVILDGALAYYGTPDQHGVSIWMLIIAGCDFVAGLLTLIARYFRKGRSFSI